MKLNKYQLGGGTEENDQYTMLATSIQQAITRGQTPQAVYESLVARKMEEKMALQLVSSVVQQMLESGNLEEEDLQQSKQKDAEAEKALLEDQQLADEELEKDNAAEEQMNAYNQQSTDIALDTSGTDQEEEDLNSMYSDDQYGFQEGGATEEEIYNSQFGKKEKEKPFSMESLMESTLGTQNFNFPGIQDYYAPYAPIGSSSDLEFVDFSNTPEKKYGGSHKKQFAKNVLNLLKKAEGGPQEDEVVDTNKAIQTDDLLGTVQKKQSSFVDAMGNTAKKLKIDEWFDKLKEVGDPMLDQILNPVSKEDPVQQQQQQIKQMLGQGEEEGAEEYEDGEEEMRYGGGKRRRKKRQYNRILNQANRLLGVNNNQSMGNRQLPFGNLPTNQYSKFNNFTDQRFNNIDAPALQKYFIDLAKQQLAQQQDNVLIPSIDVYDRGLFGRAKKYRISYNQPAPKSAEIQAEEVVVKNNNKLNKSLLMPYEGYYDEGSINPAPSGTTYDPINQKVNKPLDWQDYNPSRQPPGAPQFNNGGQYERLNKLESGGGPCPPGQQIYPEFKSFKCITPSQYNSLKQQKSAYVNKRKKSSENIINLQRSGKRQELTTAMDQFKKTYPGDSFICPGPDCDDDNLKIIIPPKKKKIIPPIVKDEIPIVDEVPKKDEYDWGYLPPKPIDFTWPIPDLQLQGELPETELPLYSPTDTHMDVPTFGVKLPINPIKRLFDKGIPRTRGHVDIGEKEVTRPIPSLVQKVTGYDRNFMEGYEDKEGNYVPGEIENAEKEGRQINFKGASSLRDRKQQKKYNEEYDKINEQKKLEELYTKRFSNKNGGNVTNSYDNGGQYGGFVSPSDELSSENLARFIYGGDDSYGESENVDDPYFSDMASNFVPQAQDGWITGPGHFLTKEELALAQEYGINDPNFDPEGSRRQIKSKQREAWIDGQMNGNSNLQGSSNGNQSLGYDYLEELQNILGNKRNIKRDIKKLIKNQRRATNTTARDYLFPANRGIYNAGSYAQQQGMPFIAGTNDMYLGSMANMPLYARDVTKRGIFGRPKQWTDYYGTGTGTSNKQEEIKLNKEYANEEEYFADQRPDYSGLSLINQMRARIGDAKSKRQTDRGIRKGVDQPMEGAITGYDNIKLLKKDRKEGETWRGYPIRNDQGLYYDANQQLKYDSEAPKGTITGEESSTILKNNPNWQDYDPSSQPPNASQFQDGGSSEQKFNFYDELENTMYDYEPDTYPSSYRRGGYLPKAEFGLDGSPVSYTNNPAFVGQSEVDWTGSGQDMFNTGLEPSSFWADQQSFNAAAPVNLNQGELPIQYNIDPNQAEEQQTKKQWDPNTLIGVNRKRKNMIGTDPQAALEIGNASANFVLGKIGQSKDAASQAGFIDQNFDPMKLYGKKDRIDKGDWEMNLGVKNINNTGSNRLGRSKQYGGGMYDQGGMYDEYLENEEDYLLDDEEEEVNEYKKGGEKITFMSEKQIKAFLAAGGELKFI